MIYIFFKNDLLILSFLNVNEIPIFVFWKITYMHLFKDIMVKTKVKSTEI